MSDSPEPTLAKPDPELHAMGGIIALLEPLDEHGRQRVIDYVFRRLGIQSSPVRETGPNVPPISGTPDEISPKPGPSVGKTTDIRTLKGMKRPGSSVEMAVLVGYYLSHAAPEAERVDSFGTKELEKYFIQAGYPIPATPRLVLFNAKKAGYLDAKSHGKYKVNAVGFNLIEHSLPGKADANSRATSAPRGPSRRRGKSKR